VEQAIEEMDAMPFVPALNVAEVVIEVNSIRARKPTNISATPKNDAARTTSSILTMATAVANG